MSTDPGMANSGNSAPCSGKCQERKHKIISVPVTGAQLQHRVPEAAPLEPQPFQGLCPTGTSGLLLSFTGSIFHFPAFLSTFQRGISLGLVEAFPHRNQLHLELALPPCIARGEEPDGSAAATAPKFSLGKLRESLWALLLEHDTNKNPQKGEMQPEPPGIRGELPQSELQHPITPHHSDLKHLGKRQHVKTVSIRQIL